MMTIGQKVVAYCVLLFLNLLFFLFFGLLAIIPFLVCLPFAIQLRKL